MVLKYFFHKIFLFLFIVHIDIADFFDSTNSMDSFSLR